MSSSLVLDQSVNSVQSGRTAQSVTGEAEAAVSRAGNAKGDDSFRRRDASFEACVQGRLPVGDERFAHPFDLAPVLVDELAVIGQVKRQHVVAGLEEGPGRMVLGWVTEGMLPGRADVEEQPAVLAQERVVRRS